MIVSIANLASCIVLGDGRQLPKGSFSVAAMEADMLSAPHPGSFSYPAFFSFIRRRGMTLLNATASDSNYRFLNAFFT